MKINLFKKTVVFTTIVILLTAFAFAQNKKPDLASSTIKNFNEIKRLAYADSVRLVEIFKDLHLHPELSFMETRTASIIAKELNNQGYEVMTGIAKTGVVGVLRNGEGPVVMYRADMDGLPIEETTGLPYASKAKATREDGIEVPVMHACGHDAHITWMLGISRIMAALKSQWKGTLIFVAQPAEEVGLGAQAMEKTARMAKVFRYPITCLGCIRFQYLPVISQMGQASG